MKKTAYIITINMTRASYDYKMDETRHGIGQKTITIRDRKAASIIFGLLEKLLSI
jgi:hypothetical protein